MGEAFVPLEPKNTPDGLIYYEKPPIDLGKTQCILGALICGDGSLEKLILLTSTLKNWGVESLSLFLTYDSFGRDEEHLKTLFTLFKALEIDKVHICEPHSADGVRELGGVPIDFQPCYTNWLVGLDNNILLVSPDKGGEERVRGIAHDLSLPYVTLRKTRVSPSEVSFGEQNPNLQNTLQGKKCIIIDDVISTGSTALMASKVLHRLGALEVHLMAAHGVFALDAAENIQASEVIQSVTVGNTLNAAKNFTKLKVCDVSEFVVEQLRQLV
jgi:ribose-phosphate pyrophosphokinase